LYPGYRNYGIYSFAHSYSNKTRHGKTTSILTQRDFDNFMEVAFLLEEILRRKVELVTAESLSPHIGPHILREVERVPIAA
jgi:hypothetical protein